MWCDGAVYHMMTGEGRHTGMGAVWLVCAASSAFLLSRYPVLHLLISAVMNGVSIRFTMAPTVPLVALAAAKQWRDNVVIAEGC